MNTNDTSTGTDHLPAPAPQSGPALPRNADAVFDLIEKMRAEISSASGGDALAALHAESDFYRRAAKLRDLWEFQVEFSLLVADCERALVKAYPSPTPQEVAARKGQPGEQPDLPNGITPGTLRKMRQAHDALSDAAYASLRSRSKEDGKALTRQMLHRAARAERDAGESEAKERSPMHDIDEGIRRSAGALVSRHNLPGIVVLAFTGSDEPPRCIIKSGDGWAVEPCTESDPAFALRAATGGEVTPDCLQPDDEREYWLGLQDYYGERMRRQLHTPDRIDRHIDCEQAEKWARALFKRQFDYWPSAEAFPFALGIKAPSQGMRASVSQHWMTFRAENQIARALANAAKGASDALPDAQTSSLDAFTPGGPDRNSKVGPPEPSPIMPLGRVHSGITIVDDSDDDYPYGERPSFEPEMGAFSQVW